MFNQTLADVSEAVLEAKLRRAATAVRPFMP